MNLWCLKPWCLAGKPWRSSALLTIFLIANTFLIASTTAPAHAGCKTPPQAIDDRAATYDQPLVIDVMANDHDPDGEALSVVLIGNTCPGNASVDPFGLVTLIPNQALTQACQLRYRLLDAANDADEAIVRIDPLASAAIFADGFESGSAAAWSQCMPSCP